MPEIVLKIVLHEFSEKAMNWLERNRDKIPTVGQSLMLLAIGILACGIIYLGLWALGLADAGTTRGGG